MIVKYQIYDLYPQLHVLPYGLNFVIGPLFYAYISSAVNKPISKRHLCFHGLWLLADYAHSFYHLWVGREVQHIFLHQILDKQGLISLLPLAVYLLLVRRLIKQFHRELPLFLSDDSRYDFRWIQYLLYTASIALVLALVQGVLDIYWYQVFDQFEPLHLVLGLILFILGFNGYLQKFTYYSSFYGTTSTLNKDRQNWIAKQLVVLLDEQALYTNPNLSIRMLEDRLTGVSGREISQSLNHVLGKNFHTFVNEFRVEAFKRKVVSGQYQHLTLFGIASDCGFSSRATFNRVFKAHMQVSPRVYVSSVQEK